MSLAQRIVLVFGFLLVLGMALFPPWKRLYDMPEYNYRRELGHVAHIEEAAGYHCILIDQSPGVSLVNLRIDTTRLAVQLIAVLTLTGMLYLLFRPART